MKTINVEELKGGEYLSRPVVNESGQMIFYEGTCVHPAQIERLKENGIETVQIFE